MAGRDMPRSPDPDDWFADPERAVPRRDRAGVRAGLPPAQASAAEDEEDDWIGADSPPPPPRGRPRLVESLPERWVAIAGAAALVVTLVVGGLALAGAFSGSSGNPAVQTTVASGPTTAPAPTTTASAAPAVRAPTTTLKPGDTGAQVKALQRALVSLGYSVGTVDGDYGTSTKTAVAEFQRAHNLTADGVFGPATRTALIKALRNS
jgi:hypothetical protein